MVGLVTSEIVVEVDAVAQTSLPVESIQSSRSFEVEVVLVWVLEKPIRVPCALEVLNQPAIEKVWGLAKDLTLSPQPVDPSKAAAVDERVLIALFRVTP